MESRKWSNLVCTHKADAIAGSTGSRRRAGAAPARVRSIGRKLREREAHDAERRESVVRAR